MEYWQSRCEDLVALGVNPDVAPLVLIGILLAIFIAVWSS